MLRKPFPYQDLCLKAIKNTPRLPLFWEMRLGKTLVAIRWLKNHPYEPKRILVVCPKSVLVSWKKELTLENENFIVIDSSFGETQCSMLEHLDGYFLVNYEYLTTKKSTLHLQSWDAIVLDESTKIRYPDTKITKLLTETERGTTLHTNFPLNSAVRKSPIKGKHQLRAVLSGSPAPEGYLDYFGQFKFLFGKMGHWKTYAAMRSQGFFPSWDGKGLQPYSRTKEAIAAYLAKYAYQLKRANVDMDLPNIYQQRLVQLSPSAQKYYTEFEQNWYIEFITEQIEKEFMQDVNKPKTMAQLEAQFAIVAQNYLHQMACGFPKRVPEFMEYHKVNEIKNIRKEELDKYTKVVIWCNYTKDIKVLLKELPHSDSLTGEDSTWAVERKLKRFNEGGTVNLICQMKKASMGMDLSAADTQIFFSKGWSALNQQQAYDRLVHPMKKDKPGFTGLLTIDLITENTVDQDLTNALDAKLDTANVMQEFIKRTKVKNPWEMIKDKLMEKV